MIFFSALKKLLLLFVCMCACFTCQVIAEESASTAEQVAEETTQPPLVEQAAKNEEESETQAADDTTAAEPVTENEVSEDTSRSIGSTPQPPLIDSQQEPSYGPKDTAASTEQDKPSPTDETIETLKTPETDQAAKTEEEAEPQAVDDTTAAEPVAGKEVAEDTSRIIGDTPQPPLIDSQEKPSYGPEDTAAPTEQDSIIPANETSETGQAPVIDQAAKAGEDAVTENTEDTVSEQDDMPAEKTAAEVEKKQQAKKWTETYPVSVNADWLQLKSGEWLRGRITIMQKDSLEFDSDELDDLVIKWKNVKYLKSYEPYSLRFESQASTRITGVIEIIKDKVHVKTDYDHQTFDRSDLLTIASGKETEISYWTSKVTFSINVRRGNTDQTDFTSKISAKRRTIFSRLVLDYLGNFTEVEDTETINNHRLNQTYDRFLSRNLYWTPIFSEFYRDPFQNIDKRVTAGIGVGYSIINTNISEWNISAGPAYRRTKFDSVQAGENQIDSTFTVALGTNFETELNSKVDLEGLYSITLGDEETGNYAHHSLLTIETELTGKLDFDVTAVWDHVRSPVADKNGNTPQQDDFRILIGLGYDL
jgi:putative salt-induced outer membrane protein YdiY